METPYFNLTHIKKCFIYTVHSLAKTNYLAASWTFVCDRLNKYKSKNLLCLVAEIYIFVAIFKTSFLRVCQATRISFMTKATEYVFIYARTVFMD